MIVKELRDILNSLDPQFDNEKIRVQGDGSGIESFKMYCKRFPTIYLESDYLSTGIDRELQESDFPYHAFLD